MNFFKRYGHKIIGSVIGGDVGSRVGGAVGGEVAPTAGGSIVGDQAGGEAGSRVGANANPPQSARRPYRGPPGGSGGGTYSFKSDATVESNIERAAIVAQGYGGVRVATTTKAPAAQGNLERGHFFPTAPSMSTGQGNRLGYR